MCAQPPAGKNRQVIHRNPSDTLYIRSIYLYAGRARKYNCISPYCRLLYIPACKFPNLSLIKVRNCGRRLRFYFIFNTGFLKQFYEGIIRIFSKCDKAFNARIDDHFSA